MAAPATASQAGPLSHRDPQSGRESQPVTGARDQPDQGPAITGAVHLNEKACWLNACLFWPSAGNHRPAMTIASLAGAFAGDGGTGLKARANGREARHARHSILACRTCSASPKRLTPPLHPAGCAPLGHGPACPSKGRIVTLRYQGRRAQRHGCQWPWPRTADAAVRQCCNSHWPDVVHDLQGFTFPDNAPGACPACY
jgi:hypothetical protein